VASEDIAPFRIEIAAGDLAELRVRLGNARWPDNPPTDAPWSAGVDAAYLRELVDYWSADYDWRLWEAQLNELGQFVTHVDTARIHFLHVRSPRVDAIPLLLAHGWPGSVVEFLKVVDPLVHPAAHGANADDAFHIVCPSMPGYGFSGPTPGSGWGVARIAAAYATLMSRLGYSRYGIHGGDWGSRVCRDLALNEPEAVAGMHVTMLPSEPDPAADDPANLSAEEQRRMQARRRFREGQSGYLAIQSTRPDTLSYALTDSPVGQLAWILDLFQQFCDVKLVPDEAIDRDQLLTNVMLYWLTRTAGSSARLYLETARAGNWGSSARVEVPTGVAVFPREIAPPIRRFAERNHNIVHWSEFDSGGHFAAMERPALLAADIQAFFRRFR